MNIQDELKKDASLLSAIKVADYANGNYKRFSKLMSCFFCSDKRLSQRAAGAVSLAVAKYPDIIIPYVKDLVDQLAADTKRNATVRNSLRVLQHAEIPEALHGKVMLRCFAFIEDAAAPAAIKAFSLTILNNLACHYPDIERELKLIIEERFDTETPAFKARARKILAGLDRV